MNEIGDKVTSWIASVASVVAACIALGSKAVVDPMLSVIISGVVIIGIGATCLIGHIANDAALYTWFGQNPGMAAETAVCFIIIGSGKIAMAVRIRELMDECPTFKKRK